MNLGRLRHFLVLFCILTVNLVCIPNVTEHLLFIGDYVGSALGMNLSPCVSNRYSHQVDLSRLVHAAASGMAGTPPVIPAEEYTPEELRRRSWEYRLPVVVRGLFAGSPACSEWDLAYFAREYGVMTVQPFETPYPTNSTFSSQKPLKRRSLHDFAVQEALGSQVVLGEESQALVNRMMPFVQWRRWKELGADSTDASPSFQFILSQSGGSLGWHASGLEELFVVASGRTLFKWLNPFEIGMADMFPALSGEGPLVEHCVGHYYEPGMKTLEVVLEKGDAVFSPAWVWQSRHHLESSVVVQSGMENHLGVVNSIIAAPLQTFLTQWKTFYSLKLDL
eukprot:TRINITY_DN22295_c0_g1_i1.p1 TRINITY_DN22295_c0_g1~~TRINITY_DN22295_c0_g1_i1.p1  ORF type:complete len:336 (-),score=48.32 TRINITY_DN22295_c0_g1_i1:85-1092(-)